MTPLTIPYFAFRDFPAGISREVELALVRSVRQNQFILGEAFEKEQQTVIISIQKFFRQNG